MFAIARNDGFGVAAAGLNTFHFHFSEFSHQTFLTWKFHLVLEWAVTTELFVEKYVTHTIETPN